MTGDCEGYKLITIKKEREFFLHWYIIYNNTI